MKVVIRADASASIGSGHIMRTLCLANALAAHGASIEFVTRDLPPHLQRMVTDLGHYLRPLPPLPSALPGQPIEAAWPDALQTADAQDTLAVTQGAKGVDWLVVDHYALGLTWETFFSGQVAGRMVIDDLNRHHTCELLLDQNAYLPNTGRYANLLTEGCRLLLGPKYALLRPEFRLAHERATPREGPVRRILVFMGGMDGANDTGLVLQALSNLPIPMPEIDVVIGAAHPARADIESSCAQLDRATCHVQTNDMAGLCLRADLAIGAGGSATWERCATGLPTIVLAVAGNQEVIASHAARLGLAYRPDDEYVDPKSLANHLQALMSNSALRNHLSRQSLAAVDGLGTQRVVDAMLTP